MAHVSRRKAACTKRVPRSTVNKTGGQSCDHLNDEAITCIQPEAQSVEASGEIGFDKSAIPPHVFLSSFNFEWCYSIGAVVLHSP